MATTSKNVIHLLGKPHINEDGAAASEIYPGMLVQGITTLAPLSTADAKAAAAVAWEREEMGLGIDDPYAVGVTVKVGVYKPGERFLGIIMSGVTVVEGSLLTSAGDGTLKVGTAADAIGRSREALTAATTGRTRVIVEVL